MQFPCLEKYGNHDYQVNKPIRGQKRRDSKLDLVFVLGGVRSARLHGKQEILSAGNGAGNNFSRGIFVSDDSGLRTRYRNVRSKGSKSLIIPWSHDYYSVNFGNRVWPVSNMHWKVIHIMASESVNDDDIDRTGQCWYCLAKVWKWEKDLKSSFQEGTSRHWREIRDVNFFSLIQNHESFQGMVLYHQIGELCTRWSPRLV